MKRNRLPLRLRPTLAFMAPFLWAAAVHVPEASAERLVPAYDPELHVKPPMALRLDGTSGALERDADFAARAARWRRENRHAFPPAGEGVMIQSGEVLILQGDDETVEFDGVSYGLRSMPAVTRRVIKAVGDNFHFITVWLSFNDKNSPMAGAYELTIFNDVSGLGPVLEAAFRRGDRSATYGSRGVLRSVLNMKRQHTGLTMPTSNVIEVWGQESAHRWLIFMNFIDPRTGMVSDAMLGRDCAHYSRFVESQGSVEDGFKWVDNGPDGMGTGNHTFTSVDATERYGNLDLYGMGLLAADEVPPFFLIDEIVFGASLYRSPRCGTPYETAPKPTGPTITGKRVDITIDSIIAANGPRIPSADESPNYWREANIVLLTPNENPANYMTTLGAQVNRGRVWWEQWNGPASQHRQVICTQLSSDCGDPRSDVVRVDAMRLPSGAVMAPAAGMIPVEVEVKNTGSRDTTGAIKVSLDADAHAKLTDTKSIGGLAVGASTVQTYMLDLTGVACGSEVPLKAYTQSDFHYHRRKTSIMVGAEERYSDGFETDAGWTVNPDGDDSSQGGRWERGKPEKHLLLGTAIQPGAAHGGQAAWVTGLAAVENGWVAGGKTTLESPDYTLTGLRDPRLRYRVAFAGQRAIINSARVAVLEDSPHASFTVLGRVDGGPWVQLDRMERANTRGWTLRNVALPSSLTAGTALRLRFIAEDAAPMQGAVEAAIDDVAVTSNLAECYPMTDPPDAGQAECPGMRGDDEGGCSCAVGNESGAQRPAAGWLVLAAAAASLAATPRRSARTTTRSASRAWRGT